MSRVEDNRAKMGHSSQPAMECMQMVECSIVFPAYNEAERIRPVLSAYATAFPCAELIVVCNGCTDDTPSLVRKICASSRNVVLLESSCRLGKGGALLEGFRHARNGILGFVDADESVSPADFGRMCDALVMADGALGSRRVAGASIVVRQPWLRRAASRAFNGYVRLLFGLPFADTQCGAKVFRRDALVRVLDDIRLSGFEFDVELLWRLRRLGFSLVEVPITWRHSPGSTFSLLHGPQMLWSLLRLRLWI